MCDRHVRVWLSVLVFGLMVQTTLGALPSEGTMEEFRPAIETISKGVVKVLKARRQIQITVGTISGPPSLGTAAGAGFRQMFVEEIQRLGLKVAKLGTEFGLSGEYRVTKVTQDAPISQIQFEVKLVDSSGQVLTDLAANADIQSLGGDVKPKPGGEVVINTFTTPEATALAMGLTADLDRYQSAIENGDFFSKDFVKELQTNPTSHIASGNQLRASSTSPYGLQIQVNSRPQPLQMENGRVFVDLKKSDVFTVKLTNESNLNVAAFFTLDGINSFAFSDVKADGRPKYAKWIVPARQSFELKGWHKNNNLAQEFKVTDFSESAAALVGASGQLGTISVVVRATWPMNTQPPPGEPMQPAGAAPGTGIGFGDDVSQRVKEDATAREYGRVRSIMTIHYIHAE